MRKILFLVTFLFISSNALFAQNAPEKYKMGFSLDGEPSLSEVGLNSDQAKWEVKFWLRLVDKETLDKDAININDKEKMAKAFKKKFKPYKKGVFITKGKFKKTNLSDPANRTICYDVVLPDKAFETMPKDKKLYFIFTTKTVIKVPGAKKKLKRNLQYPLDLDSIPNQFFEMQYKVIKEENGMYSIGHYISK
ncbi:MAG: hypothetical protein ACR2LT_06615 [Pyrinomonadaceae bacterium]